MDAAEYELKFDVSDEALPMLCKVPALGGPAHTSRLRSIYFDTPDRDLRKACLGLRVRQSEEGLVQTLKWEKPSAPLARHEWETQVAAERPDPGALADTPAGDVLSGDDQRLEPVFTTTVERTRRF